MKTIKIIIIIIILFFGGMCLMNAQERIGFTALHDVKLGLGMDKQHNNSKSVLNVILAVDLEGKQFEWYYLSIQPFYEYANLQESNYHRYGVNAKWNFNRLVIDKLTVSPGLGIGMIFREGNGGSGSYQFLIDLSYPITKDLSFIGRNEWVRRTDLLTPKLGYNVSVGLNYKL